MRAGRGAGTAGRALGRRWAGRPPARGNERGRPGAVSGTGTEQPAVVNEISPKRSAFVELRGFLLFFVCFVKAFLSSVFGC